MKKIAVWLVLAASLGLGACGGANETAPQTEPLDQEAAAVANKKAEEDADAAKAAKAAELQKQLEAASRIEELAAVVTAAGGHPDIKKAAQDRLETQVRPIIDGATKSWAPLDELMLKLPNSNPLWSEAWAKKEQLKSAAKK